MGYSKTLKLSLIPTTLYFFLSLVSIILTAHYWIIGDWLMGRWIAIPTSFNARTQKMDTDDTIVDYTEPSTNATIVSGCLSLTTAVMAGIAWHKLRRRDMDSDYMLPMRRFYTVAVFIAGTAAVAAALASIATHVTDKSDGPYGCSAATFKTKSGTKFTNLLCSREQGACNFFKYWLEGTKEEWTATVACNEVITVKWLQIVLILNALVIMALFGLQARQRKKMRWMMSPKGKEPISAHI